MSRATYEEGLGKRLLWWHTTHCFSCTASAAFQLSCTLLTRIRRLWRQLEVIDLSIGDVMPLLRPAVLLIVRSLTSLQQLRFILTLQCVIQGCGRCVLQLACCLSCREKFTAGDENVHCIFFQLVNR